MNDFIEKIFFENKLRLMESNLKSNIGEEYWHVVVLEKNDRPISGGFHKSKKNARKIAFAEFLERDFYRKIHQNKKMIKEWGIDLISTGCGFAAGFEKDNTIKRSLNEAIERWVMSQWVDNSYHIEQIQYDEIQCELTAASKYFISFFKDVMFFKKDILIEIGGAFHKITVVKTMGISEVGIFPGSSSHGNGNQSLLWEHAILESFRHYLAVKNNSTNRNFLFPENKVHYFSKNKDKGIKAIKDATNKHWPTPKIKFFNTFSEKNNNYFISRFIVDGWRSWNEGPIDRFLF